MPQVAALFLQVVTFFVQNKAQIIQLIQNIEALIPDVPGDTKATQVKNFIATSLGIEAQIESVWPAVSPIFNLIVAAVKKPA